MNRFNRGAGGDDWDALGGSAVGLDWETILCVTALVAFGTVMVFSATSSAAAGAGWLDANTGEMRRQLASVALAVLLGAAVFRVPLSFWFRWSGVVGWLCLIVLCVVFLPHIGKSVNGARRWLQLGPLSIQVSELVKVGVLIFAAAFTVKRQEFMHSFSRGFLPIAIPMGAMAFLLMQQPDLGATAVVSVEMLGILFLGGLSIGIFSAVGAFVVCLVAVIIIKTPWRLSRVLAYLDPWSEDYVLGQSYQLSHSLIAFGRGELFGVGLGGSVEKLNYLPEAHTDFIMAVIAEETGLVGVILVLFVFYWLIRRAFEIGRQAIKLERFFAGLLAQGVGLWFGVQVVINVGVASGALPTKGLTLPFVSFGGSAMLSSMIAIGLLLRVDRENKILMRGGQV